MEQVPKEMLENEVIIIGDDIEEIGFL
ncbi:Protein of unknown function [Bacillus cytotoxicus]|nr:Protein of unknown function [Bacillus cytotoxicus]